MATRLGATVLLISSIIALAVPVQSIDAQDPDFGEPISLGNALDQHALQIASTENSLYVLWSDSGLIFKASNDNGVTFVDAKNSPGYPLWPQMATSGNSVYVVSIGNGPWPHQSLDIFFSASHDNGATFGSIINLSDSPKWSDEPHVAASGNYVYVAWKDESSGDGDVYFTKSADQGASFDPVINLGALTGAAGSPRVAAEGNNVYVVWDEWTAPYGTEPRNLEVLFRASNDNGATFGPVINLSSNAGNSYYQEIAAFGNNVYVVWKDSTPGNFDILFRASNDNGATFGPVINLSENGLGSSEYPQIAASGSNVYVVWDDSFRTNVNGVPVVSTEVLFRASNDNGATFGNLINLSNNKGTSQSPQIAVSENNVNIAWRDSGFPDDYLGGTFIKTSGDKGNTFENTVSVYKPESPSWDPVITASKNGIHVVWEALLPSKYGGYYGSMIMYARNPPLPICDGIMATIVGTESDDIIEGTLGDDVIVGLGGNDVIYGEGGNDTICGGAGDDEIFGGSGNDRIYGESGNDVIFGGAGDDIINGNGGSDTLFGGDDAGNAVPEASSIDSATSGVDGNDRISGGAGNDTILGEIGNDTIYGGAGDDEIHAGAGNDSVLGGGGNDFIFGGAGDDIINGNGGSDTLFGGDDAGNAVPEASSIDSATSGVDGNDRISGGNGNDMILGEIGDDTINGNGGGDTLDCGDGMDNANGAKGKDTATDCETMNKIP